MEFLFFLGWCLTGFLILLIFNRFIPLWEDFSYFDLIGTVGAILLGPALLMVIGIVFFLNWLDDNFERFREPIFKNKDDEERN